MKSIVILCLGLCLLLTGCPSGETKYPMPDDKGKMVLRVLNGAEAATLDPIKREGTPGTSMLSNIFEGLVRVNNKTGGYLPGVAERWEISEDGTTYTFFLRKDAKWSDGKPVTANDFLSTYRRAVDPITQSRNASLYFVIKNARAVLKNEKKTEELGVFVVDDYTLKIELESPTGYFMSLLSLVPFYATPKHVIDKHGNAWTELENIVSNGPFKVVLRRRNDRTEVVKNENYWGKDEVKLDKIIFFTTDNGETRLRMFRANAADYHVTGLASSAYPGIKNNPEWVMAPYLGIYYYIFNTKEAPFDNAKVRKAISMAIDREILAEVLSIGYIPAKFIVPPRTAGYKTAASLEENVEKAKQLLKEAGYGEGGKKFPTMTILYNTNENHQKVAIVVSDMLKRNLGIDVKIENAEWKTYLDRRRHGDYQVARAGWIGDYNDADSFLELMYSESENNDTFWKHKKYDELFLKSRKISTPEKRLAVMQEAEKIALDEMPIMPIYFYVADTLVKPYVKNFYPSNKKDVEQGFYDLQARAVFRDAYIDMEEKKKYFGVK
ncbi:peptide ABC transporter substrate-binding protein [Candidatus Uabimicrobium amorphum]|uniref:Peptide ABC transporter substrate-binding protein n=1 Tax=Uabimicrobium amorphum TaxID=2596890 RepID=A0A5S9IQG8_UABAM|nr:peptide ABC transporter substrate-binding protein [Candidatus Uabimicrobium amorphum]BBM85290.1 peptide ABC transporter substrate-binding protein [Candidatus Uabimicrobium amorphum]